MGYPGGTRSVLTRAFRVKKKTWLYISGEKGNHCYIQTRHNNRFFFPLQSFSRKTLGKIGPKSAHTERVYRIVLMPPGHPIIFLKSS